LHNVKAEKGSENVSGGVENRAGVVEALDRILARSEFVASPRQQAFLRFVVEETLADRGNRLKAFTIATSIFGRNETFDPQKNSIVRVEALRLRRLLDQYYDGPGADDPLHIRLRRGTYVPEFIEKSNPAIALAPRQAPEPGATLSIRHAEARRARPWLVSAALGGGALAALAFVVMALPAQQLEAEQGVAAVAPEALRRNATISVGPIRANAPNAATGALADRLTHEIEDKLSLFDNPVVVESASSPSQSDYHLSGAVHSTAAGALALSFRMTRRGAGSTKEIIWARRFDNFQPGAGEEGPQLDAMMTSIAQSYGAIHADIRRRLRQTPGVQTAYDCVVMAFDAFDAPTQENLTTAENCLDQALARDPTFAAGHAALSYLNVARWLDGIPDEPGRSRLEAGRRFARDAARLAPSKARMHAAKFWSRFFAGRYDEAFDEARIALRLNPYSTDTLARFGAARILLGQIDEGEELLDRAARASVAAPSWQDFFMFLAAYVKGDWPRAVAYGSHSGSSLFPLGIIAQIVIANHRGDAAAAQDWRARLTSAFPGFASDIEASLKRWSMSPEIRSRLLVDINIAPGSAVLAR
jgi:adenylate cyclase